MLIGIASGKGGTGKTTVAVNLAAVIDEPVRLLDCDVEEPNAHLFLKPEIRDTTELKMDVPEIDLQKCTFCRKCQEICQFNAIAVLPETALTFAELCHSCGGCFLVCEEKAINVSQRVLGTVYRGAAGSIGFAYGRMRVGEAMAPPLIRRLRSEPFDGVTIIDAPPGTSCPVVHSLHECDFALLVTEPTPFGLNDLKLAVGVARKLTVPMGIVINRARPGARTINDYADSEGIPVVAELPFARRVAEAYARGKLLVDEIPEWRKLMTLIYRKIREAVQ